MKVLLLYPLERNKKGGKLTECIEKNRNAYTVNMHTIKQHIYQNILRVFYSFLYAHKKIRFERIFLCSEPS